MNEYTFLSGFSEGFSMWSALNQIAPFAKLLGFGVAVTLTLALIRILLNANK